MKYSVTDADGHLTVRMSGRLTFSDMPSFLTLLTRLTPGTRSCVFDLGDLEMIDSTGLSLFIYAHDAGQAANFPVIVRNAAGAVRSALERASFDALLTIE